MPSEKRARQREGREQRRAEEAKAAARKKRTRQIVIVAVVAVVVVGSVYLFTRNSSKSSTSTTTTTQPAATTTTTSANSAANAAAQAKANKIAVAAGCPASTSTRVNDLTWSSAPAMSIDTSKTYVAHVSTTLGDFEITLDAKSTPQTVNNFVFLAEHNFYRCVIFHRVIPNFMDQTGDPTGTGSGGPGYTIPDEYPAKASNPSDQYPIGSVAMANTGQPHTGGSQFFIVTGSEGESLSNTYSLFGTVTQGMSVVQAINADGNASPSSNGVPPDVTQRILNITITSS